MRIRKLAPPDREGVAAIVRSDSTFSDEEVEVALELVDEALDMPSGDYRVLVAADDSGGMMGYVCYGPTPMTRGTYDLYWIATHRQARGQGVATKLVEAMEAELRAGDARIVRIETSHLEEYSAARSFYARLAYVEVGRIRDFYKPGDDLVTLAKRFEPAVARDVPAEARHV